MDIGSVLFSSGNGTSNLDFSGGANPFTVGSVTHTHLAGTSSTTFSGSKITVNGAISVTNGDGNDTFDLSGIDFTANAITIRNGNGNGTTRIDATGSNTIRGNISITNGDGSDTFRTGGTSFTLGTATARRNLTIRNGNGGGDSQFLAATNTVNGSIAVTNGTAFDTFAVGGGVFNVTGAGNVTISNGVGGSDTSFQPSTSASIGGKLTMTSTDGDDDVTLLRLTVTGGTAISTGNGGDGVTIGNSTFNGLLSINLGAGVDALLIEDGTLNDGVSSVFNAAVNINMGNGDDTVQIGVIGDANDFGDFNAGITVTGGLDLDIVQALSNAANTFAIPPVVTGFEQGT